MSEGLSGMELPEADGARACVLFAVDPHGLGGVVLRGRPGPARDTWLEQLAETLPDDAPIKRIPIGVSHDRLLGGLDFAGTMSAGRPVYSRGLLEAANDGVVTISMAERLHPASAAIVAAALDDGELPVERDGLTRRCASRFGVVALDEGIDDECIDMALADRLAFTLDIEAVEPLDVLVADWSVQEVIASRKRLNSVVVDDGAIKLLTETAAKFAIRSVRAVLFAVRTARASAACSGRSAIVDDDLMLAVRLVYPQRALALPEQPQQPAEDPQTPDTPDDEQSAEQESEQKSEQDMPEDVLVDAIAASLPPDLLQQLQQQAFGRQQKTGGSRGGPKTRSRNRGRPIGARQSELGGGRRLNVLATLKAAAPWQALRRAADGEPVRKLRVRKEDIHTNRYEDRVETTTIFAVDASGSQAAQRLAEVKGAIELLLNDCYVRRDQVALIAFRGKSADALLPPTRALARVKRSLRALPGGGGTPLAAGLDAARQLALAELRHGRNATIVLLTDGRANITRDGEAVADAAEADALASGRQICADGIHSLLVDTSRRPRPRARDLAAAMHATYVPLPYADAKTISDTVQRSVS